MIDLIISVNPVVGKIVQDDHPIPKFQGVAIQFSHPVNVKDTKEVYISFLDLPKYVDKTEIAENLTRGVTDPKKRESIVAPLKDMPMMRRPEPQRVEKPVVSIEQACDKNNQNIFYFNVDMNEPEGLVLLCDRLRNPSVDMDIKVRFNEALCDTDANIVLPKGTELSASGHTICPFYDKFHHESLEDSAGNDYYYEWLEPNDIVQGKKYPLMIWLGGANINYNGFNRGVQIYSMAVEEIMKYPEEKYILLPQTDNVVDWFGDCIIEKEIRDFAASHPVDLRRIYCFGHSNGGINTWRLAVKLGDLFAGIMPGSAGFYGPGETESYSEEKYKARLKKVTEHQVWVRAHHGTDDSMSPAIESIKSAKLVEELYREQGMTEEEIRDKAQLVLHTEEEGTGAGGHNIASWIYTQENIRELMSHKKGE